MPNKLLTALMPFWLIGLGALAGLLALAAIWAVMFLVYRRGATRLWEICRETVVMPVLVTAAVLAGYTMITTLLDTTGFHFFDPKSEAIESILRLSATTEQEVRYRLMPTERDFLVELEVPYGEFKQVEIESDRSVTVTIGDKFEAVPPGEDRIPLLSNEAWSWSRSRELSAPFDKLVQEIYLSNTSDSPARVRLLVETEVLVPQAAAVPWTAVGVVAFVMFYWLMQSLFPKVAAVALTTGKEAAAQPLFYLLLGIGAVLLLTFVVVPYNTFGEDVKILKETGTELIKVLAIIVALWTASVAVADEIEGRTALTVLSKPISRRQFILGKYFGVCSPVAVMFVLLGILFLFCVSYKVLYDAREGGNPDVTWIDCYREAITTVPGLLLAFMEACVLVSISVAISTRLPILPNLLICVSIYSLGHLVPLLVNSTVGQLEYVQFIGQLFALILPVLEYYNVSAAIYGGGDVPLSYMAWALLYSVIYVTIVMMIALALFEDRDLA